MKYRIKYEERLFTVFGIDIPDDVPAAEAQTYIDEHWDALIEPNIGSPELEVLDHDLDIRPME